MAPDCALCLDFGHLGDLGPCPWCDPDHYAEHVLDRAARACAAMTAEDNESIGGVA